VTENARARVCVCEEREIEGYSRIEKKKTRKKKKERVLN